MSRKVTQYSAKKYVVPKYTCRFVFVCCFLKENVLLAFFLKVPKIEEFQIKAESIKINL